MNTPDAADTALQRAAEAIRHALDNAHNILVVTGAGVSAESGMPTFRAASTDAPRGANANDPRQPLWERFRPEQLATPEAFATHPAVVSAWYRWRRAVAASCQPNPGHTAIAQLEHAVTDAGGSFTLATQNVDGLHQRAGSATHNGTLLGLHGSIDTWRNTSATQHFAGDELDDILKGEPPYRCPHTDEPLRPAVVWFGEALPEHTINRAIDAASNAHLFFSIGTSAQVYPAAGLIDIARRNGAVAIEVNAEATPASSIVDHALRATSGTTLPTLLKHAGIREHTQPRP